MMGTKESVMMTVGNNKMCTLLLAWGVIMLLKPKKRKRTSVVEDTSTEDHTLIRSPNHNVIRMAAISKGGPTDHSLTAGTVTLVVDEDFSLDRTIFATVDSKLNRKLLHFKLGCHPYWSDAALASIRNTFQAKFGPIPPLPDVKTNAIIDFMEKECNFSMEHADGSFMEHLLFCRDYSAAHYRGHSPNVLFLHSICGVATNFFPMSPGKLPALAKLLMPDELLHITAFPSILRLLYAQDLLDQLKNAATDGRLDRLSSIKFRRVMDNVPMELNGKEFWEHLNYHVMHLLDFLPSAFWREQMSDPLFGLFVQLHGFLVSVGKLEATVDFSLTSPSEAVNGVPLSLGLLVYKYVPLAVTRTLAAKQIKRWSAQKGHGMDFELSFA